MTSTKQPVPHPTFQDRHGATWYVWKDTAVMPHVADMYVERKRLTDAELAAEYWAAVAYIVERQGSARGHGKTHSLTVATNMHHFGTRPHAHENGYQ